MSGENTPSSGKRSFSSASLSPTSPSSSQHPKKANMSVDVDSLIDALTNDRVKAALTSSFTTAFLVELEKRDRVIEALQSEVIQLKADLSELKREKTQEQERIATELDEQEQYSRRNNHRVFFTTPEHSQEDTTQMVLDHAKTIGVALTPADIDRSHRVGKAGRGSKPRPVIVKFTSYWRRKEFFDSRKKDPIFIAEDLTDKRANLLYHARELRRKALLKYCWTRDGSVFVRRLDETDNQSGNPVSKIRSLHDLLPFGLDPAILTA